MAVINTNVKALFSQMALGTSGRAQTVAMQQLSSGKRVNSARDDAAGMAIATRMTHQIRSLNQAVRNANDAINLIQTAEGATNEITDMMQRMRELAVQAVNDTNDNAQRSYLDLEFQQLKQQIVQISDNTEWNGFPVLNGTAGERVGEMPVYKATSNNLSGSVFINPTTTRSISGSDAGEQQTMDFTAVTPSEAIIKVAGIDVNIVSLTDTASVTTYAAKVKSTLEATNAFNPTTSGRTIVNNAGVLTFTFAGSEGDVAKIPVLGVAPVQVDNSRKAVTQAVESFSGNGAFTKSGSLSMSVSSAGVVTASFLTSDNNTIQLTGVADPTNSKVTFAKATNTNGQILSDDVTYTFKDSTGTNSVVSTRALSMSVNVEGSIPALRNGDLQINGIEIGASYPSDDPFSPINNAAGSAIAKVAAINRKAVDSGTSQGETQSLTFSGTPTVGTITVAGIAVTLTAQDNTTPLVAAKVAAALKANPQFDTVTTGRVVSYAPGSSVVNVTFATKEGDVPALSVLPGTTGVTGLAETTAKNFTASPGTGVFAKVNENIMSGKAMSGTAVVSGVVFINGYASADITTVMNNTRESRAAVVRAINLITDKTGVKAIDTGSDAKGISLVAQDGRNIEVRFETAANADEFGNRTGLRQGVQAGTYSLESKIQAPIVLTSSSTGDITRAGLINGNFTKNESVVNTSPRTLVGPAQAQVESYTIGGTVARTDTFVATINGKTYTSVPVATTTLSSPAYIQAARDSLISQINTDTTLGVTAVGGNATGEFLLTASVPGTSFTLTSSKTSASGTIANVNVKPNAPANFKPLGMDDLVINGVKIRPTTSADDQFSSTATTSSDKSSSAIAIANAINSQSPDTGVRAIANPAVTSGMNTVTSVPENGNYHLYVNGVDISVAFVKDERGTQRRQKVMAAINERTGQHGITASDNGNGITLSSDGRNMSVWFDSNVKNLSAASFGLDKGGSVAQVSRISVGGATTAIATDRASVVINGQTITSATAAVTPQATLADLAANLKAAIDAAITSDAALASPTLQNIKVEISGTDIVLTSYVAGSPFELKGASIANAAATGTSATLALATVTANSMGNNDVTAIGSIPAQAGAGIAAQPVATSKMAKTVYGTVRMISDPALLPKSPAPGGAPPSDQMLKLNATGKAFTISSGDDGFGPNSNFAALGFQEGTFGGRSSEDMDPPKVGRLAFQVGASAQQVVTIDLADFGKNGPITSEITGDVDLNVEQRTARINTSEGATDVLTKLDAVMDRVNATRATMGAVMNRLDHVVTNLTNVSMNLSASRSTIEDADYASASTELAKTQIMQQAATAVLAQANTSQQSVLKLLGN
jgi:flagellin